MCTVHAQVLIAQVLILRQPNISNRSKANAMLVLARDMPVAVLSQEWATAAAAAAAGAAAVSAGGKGGRGPGQGGGGGGGAGSAAVPVNVC